MSVIETENKDEVSSNVVEGDPLNPMAVRLPNFKPGKPVEGASTGANDELRSPTNYISG